MLKLKIHVDIVVTLFLALRILRRGFSSICPILAEGDVEVFEE